MDLSIEEMRIMKRILCTAALFLCVFISTSTVAADAYVTGDVELRAGPDPGYPSVAMLSDGTSVSILGCVDNWSWCDISYGDERGWVAGDFLQQEYQGQRVFLPEYAVEIGIPIVTFEFDTYWNSHYHNRPWFGERERFSKVRPQYRPPAHAHAGPSHAPPQQSNVQRSSSAGTVSRPANQPKPPIATTPQRSVAVQARPVEKDSDRDKAAAAAPHAAAPNVRASAAQHPVATQARPPEQGTSNAGSVEAKAAPKAPPKQVKKATPKPPEHDEGKDRDKEQN